MIAELGGRYADVVNAPTDDGLVGLVDMHVHPVAHLGFGTELVYGEPDGDPTVTLGDCGAYHFFPVKGGGNIIRRFVAEGIAGEGAPADAGHDSAGWPTFRSWPSWHGRLHQQARVEWLERAWRGGLRVIVALAVNSHILADLAETRGPYDDRTSGDQQIAALHQLVGRHDFMRVVRSAAELRACVRSGRLAVVIGVELDNIGNFYSPGAPSKAGAPFRPQPSENEVIAEIDRLIDAGVRYFFPVHLTDNVLGGAAVYDPLLAAATRYNTGRHLQVEPAPPASGIGYTHTVGSECLRDLGARGALSFSPFDGAPTPPPTASGHRNVRGLTPLGEVAIRHLMRRGVLIDIDHMSERTVHAVLRIAEAEGYPLVAGHAGLRAAGGSERQHSSTTMRRLFALGGMVGVGLAEGLQHVAEQTVKLSSIAAGARIGIGSDATGMEHTPRPLRQEPLPQDAASRQAAGLVVYADQPGAPAHALRRCVFGDRRWDYSSEGWAHIGLLPDMLEELHVSGLLAAKDLATLFRSAEGFARTWEACRSQRPGARWTTVDTNRLTISVAATAGRLFQLQEDGSIWEYTGVPRTGWMKLDANPATTAIVADGGQLYQLHDNGSIWRYTGTPLTGWAKLDHNKLTRAITADSGQLYQLHSDGSIWRFTGTPLTGWAKLDANPATTAIAADGGQLYQLHDNGSIWRYTGTPLTGWAKLDANPATTAIAADGGQLYQLHDNGSIWRYTGTPLTGWAKLDANPATTAIAADGGQLYQLHDNGSIWRYTGTPLTGWAQIGGDATTTRIHAADGELYEIRDNGHLLRWTPPLS